MKFSNEVFEIGDVDKLKIMFSSQTVTFINSSNPNKKTIYNYSQIKEVKFNKGKTYWLLSVASLIFDFFSSVSVGAKHRGDRNIEILTTNERLTINFCKSDLKNAEKIVILLHQNANAQAKRIKNN